MTLTSVKGRIHSIQSLGTVDGPGVRFVAFMQGCPLRCACCHNPDTWDKNGGEEISSDVLVKKAESYKSYFGEMGGITLSGGEPLLQPAFCTDVFRRCHEAGIHTCLDTSGYALDDQIKDVLAHCDRVLLDIKYTNDADYLAYAGCKMEAPLAFLAYLNEKGIPTTLRQVIIPTRNDSDESILRLKAIRDAHACVDKVELLPFRKICEVKYQRMDIPFRFADIPEPTRETMQRFEAML